MPFHLTSTYLLPAIFLNPAFVLHLINTFISHLLPPPPTMSVSPHPIFESLGPLPGTDLAFDMHEDDALCWRYTFVMVVVQLLAFGRVSNNRVRRSHARASRAGKDKSRKEKTSETVAADEPTLINTAKGFDGATDSVRCKNDMNHCRHGELTETEESMVETSEEEIIV
ncbi:hypothetical protein CJF32_00004018 [Rutstroemia sp. NJR-2017a WRK4]|nr:hypothetical protein CJF32_00004018 [Rutstroemia sp. NJR-2017a WRK4]